MAITLPVKLFYYLAFFHLRTPLRLRDSLRRLRQTHPHPYSYPALILLRLFIPYPTWHFPLPDPLPPREILSNTPLLLSRRTANHLPAALDIPIWRARDTPLRTLYRIYESVLAGDTRPAATETEYFFYRDSWALEAIPDPREPDPVRYAVIAGLVEELVEAFKWRLECGLRRDQGHVILRSGEENDVEEVEMLKAPGWTGDVRAVMVEDVAAMMMPRVWNGRVLVLGDERDETRREGAAFARRNLGVGVEWMYRVPGMKAPELRFGGD